MKTFPHVIQAPYNTIQHADFHLKGVWKKNHFKNNNPIILELGCGKGEYSVNLAEINPNKNFIGTDIKGARIWTGAKMAEEKQLKNVAFLRTNIEIIDQFFGANEVDEIWLTFPDPQMKKVRKRLTSSLFLKRYKKFLKHDGVVHLKTDSNFQFSYTKALVNLNKLEIIAETENLYNSTLLNETLKIKTFYEKQWLNRGKTIKYLAFKLNSENWKEPEDTFEKDDYRSFGRSANVN